VSPSLNSKLVKLVSATTKSKFSFTPYSPDLPVRVAEHEQAGQSSEFEGISNHHNGLMCGDVHDVAGKGYVELEGRPFFQIHST